MWDDSGQGLKIHKENDKHATMTSALKFGQEAFSLAKGLRVCVTGETNGLGRRSEMKKL